MTDLTVLLPEFADDDETNEIFDERAEPDVELGLDCEIEVLLFEEEKAAEGAEDFDDWIGESSPLRRSSKEVSRPCPRCWSDEVLYEGGVE
jgi:hypothetical protein